MKMGIATAVFAGLLSFSAHAADEYTYNMITGQLPNTGIIAADVVRSPAFTGEKDEQVQAMDQAKGRLDAEYCQTRGGEFVADPGLIVYDKGIGQWMVGGMCR
jgi:hypothetical protein